ncbi:hypothetical protein JQ584_47620 [Bradyrhizobium liaoningense]|nr:hypothetical protein [Bradyrhizobium liaoningense]
MLLTKKLSVRLDDKDLGQLGFLRCFSKGSIAQMQDATFVD